jgi:hypothetical protein
MTASDDMIGTHDGPTEGSARPVGLVSDKDPKIFGIGLSRTGTLSLATALGMLGIPSRHYPDDRRTQYQLRKGDYHLSILDHYQALTDIPVAPFFRELDHAFPGSRFVLTTRDTDDWLRSVERHFALWVRPNHTRFDDFNHAATYGCLMFQSERFRGVKERHEAEVRAHFANRSGDLLVLDVASAGWDPLCAFLGKQAPDAEYPHSNRALERPAVPGLRVRLRQRASGLIARFHDHTAPKARARNR